MPNISFEQVKSSKSNSLEVFEICVSILEVVGIKEWKVLLVMALAATLALTVSHMENDLIEREVGHFDAAVNDARMTHATDH
jgi:hypothetical protein